MTNRLVAVMLCLTLAAAATASAQTAVSGGKPVATPVQVQVLLSRYRADKKISSVPYSLSVKPQAFPRGANLRLMTSVPVGFVIDEKTGQRNFNFRDIGVQIDASASPLDDGRYEVSVTISEQSLYTEGKPPTPGMTTSSDVQMVRSYTSNNALILRDGQTSQYTAATDPVTGEIVRVDVTLTVPK